MYDAKGRVFQTSRPYYTASDTPRYTSYSYDDLGRVIQAVMPDSSVTNFCFNGLKSSVTNNLNQTTTTIKNAQGLNASVVQGTGVAVGAVCDPATTITTTNYVYDAFGGLLTVTDTAGNVITNTYDIRGNKISSIDPDMGTWTYAYDVLGELTNQTDAKSQATTLTYDLLGRPLSRTESGLFSSWTYGTSPGAHNIGKVIDAQTCTASGCASVVSDRSFTFDSLGRPDAVVLHAGANDYGYHYTYGGTNGLLSNLQYPSGYSVNYSYNSYGYLTSLADTNGASIWTANARDAEMHLTSQTQGNGILTTQAFDPNTGWIQNQRAGGGATISFDYSFDTIGNLTARTDNIQVYTERFCYDSLNRVINFNIAAACTGGKTAAYDGTGNITSRSEVGTYSYPTSGSARPHAVSSITGSVDGLTNPKYTYDANGNMTCTSTGTNCTGTIGRQFTVTSFNMAATLTQGTTSLTLTYDDQHTRIVQAATVSGTTTTTTYLNDPVSGAMSQKVQVGSAIPQWVDYIQADGQIVAQRTVSYPSGSLWGFNNWAAFNWGPPPGSVWGSFNWGSGTWTGPLVTWAYFSLDYLGSVAAITDQGGTIVQSLFYDPWGKRRNANGTDTVCGTITSTVTRGFTNQEQMPMGCFVNLNARVYDAKIGRFLAPNSVVPDPMNGQAFNRFSYVNNNPLSFVDPTGHDGSSVIVTGYRPPNIPNPGRTEQAFRIQLGDIYQHFGASGLYFAPDRGVRDDPAPSVSSDAEPPPPGTSVNGLSPLDNGRGVGGGALASIAANLIDGSLSNETVIVTGFRDRNGIPPSLAFTHGAREIPRGKNGSVTYGFSGTAALGVGVTVSVSATFASNGQISVSGTAGVMVGPGAYVGAGEQYSAGLSMAPAAQGWSTGSNVFGEADLGYGPVSVGGSGALSLGSNGWPDFKNVSGGVSGRLGQGVGAYAGVGKSGSITYTFGGF